MATNLVGPPLYGREWVLEILRFSRDGQLGGDHSI